MTLTWMTGIELYWRTMNWTREGNLSSFSFVQTFSFPEEVLKKEDNDKENLSNDSQSLYLEEAH